LFIKLNISGTSAPGRIALEKKARGKYTTVHIPTVMAELIDNVLEADEFAYASRSEFIKDAVRRFLEYYGHYPRSGSTARSQRRINDELDQPLDATIANHTRKIIGGT